MGSRRFYGFVLLQIVVGCGLLLFVFSLPGPWDLQRIVGTTLMVAALSGIVIARHQLGRSFSVRAEAHQLVTHGIYSRIRNPIYVFGTILLAGFTLVIHRPVVWLLVVASVVMQTIRARREARVLEAAFGDAYREYRRKTWF
jgi:protein-S-isoprenylcysteine O-methyltransferase Ste14